MPPTKYTYEYFDDEDWVLGNDQTQYDTPGEAVEAGYTAGYADVRATEHPQFDKTEGR